MSEINRYHIFVNTALRSNTSQSSSNFSINVNPPLTKEHPNHYFVAQVVSVEIPYSWNQINATNNSLGITYQNINYTIRITPGNYTVTNLITELATQVNKTIPAHTWSDNTTYNPNTGVLTFGITGLTAGSTTTYVLAYNFPGNSFLGRIFGCLNNNQIIFGYGQVNSVYQYINVSGSTNVNVNPVSSIYIRSSNLKQLKNQENLVKGYEQDPSDILCKIQAYTPPKTWIFYNGELGLNARITNPIIDKLDIYLSDNSSFNLDLNNNDWTFRITFVEYRPFELTEAFLRTKELNGSMNQMHYSTMKQNTQQEESNTDPEQTIVPIKQKKFQRET
jgi:hypothetical protein